MAVIKPFLANKPRGAARMNDCRVLNGIFWIRDSGAPWRDLPESFGRTQSLLDFTRLLVRFPTLNRNRGRAEVQDA